LIGSKFVGTELVGGLTKILGELGHQKQVIARSGGRIVAALEFFQRHFSSAGYYDSAYSVLNTVSFGVELNVAAWLWKRRGE
jgi:hypothetical protein